MPDQTNVTSTEQILTTSTTTTATTTTEPPTTTVEMTTGNGDGIESFLEEFVSSDMGKASLAIMAVFVLVVVLFFVWRCFCRKKQKPKRAIKYNAAGSTYHYKPPKAKPQKTQPSADVYNKNNASKTDMDGSSKIDFPLTKYSSLPPSLLTDSDREKSAIKSTINKKSKMRPPVNKRNKESSLSIL
uniref:Uncharacterized protein n=1 Tax=Meloidogyne enterolobii TaxID=390850 RepID=A0A6V7WJ94_MELEN|nr:unnamed protein product [Meloidogyne enterolobii]